MGVRVLTILPVFYMSYKGVLKLKTVLYSIIKAASP